MHIMQSRRDFLSQPCPRPAPRASLAPGIARRRGAAGDDHDPATATPTSAWRLQYIAEELLRAEGFTDIRYVADLPVDAVARGEIDFDFDTAAWIVYQRRCRRADHGVGGRASRVLRAVRARAHPSHQRPEGQEASASQQLGSSAHLLLSVMAAQVGLDPHEDIEWVASPTATPWSCSPKAKSMLSSAFPPEPQELRARKIGRVILNTGHGPAVVAVSLLHRVRQQGVRPRSSDRHQALPACHPQGRRHLRRPSRRGPRDSWSMAGSPSDTTTRCRR